MKLNLTSIPGFKVGSEPIKATIAVVDANNNTVELALNSGGFITAVAIEGIDQIPINTKVMLDQEGNVTVVEKKESTKSSSASTGARTPGKDFTIKQRNI